MHLLCYLSVNDFLGDHCSEGRQQEKEDQRSSLNPGATLFCGASAISYWSQPQILCLPSPYVPVVGVSQSSKRLEITLWDWYCVGTLVSPSIWAVISKEVIYSVTPAHTELLLLTCYDQCHHFAWMVFQVDFIPTNTLEGGAIVTCWCILQR